MKENLHQVFPNTLIAWSKANYPILDVNNEKLRALFVVVIGCDVFKGINGVTLNWIAK